MSETPAERLEQLRNTGWGDCHDLWESEDAEWLLAVAEAALMVATDASRMRPPYDHVEKVSHSVIDELRRTLDGERVTT